MATDQYLIVLPRSCIGSLQGKASIESQSIQPIMPAAGLHGLSAQDGALRPLLCTSEMEFDHRSFTNNSADTWPSWHGRRRRVEVDGEERKWSFPKQADFTVTTLYCTGTGTYCMVDVEAVEAWVDWVCLRDFMG